MHCICKAASTVYLAIVCYLMSETLEWYCEADKVVPTFPFSLVNRPPPPVTPHPTPTNQNENMQTNKMPALYQPNRMYRKMQLFGSLLSQGGCLKVKPCNPSALMAGLSHHIPN